MKDDRSVPSNPANSNAILLKGLLDLVLQFLSTCSNETMLIVLACLMGATYAMLGRLGLIIIGVTLGVTLHASWEGPMSHDLLEARASRRTQLSLDVARRLLDWPSGKVTGNHQADYYSGKNQAVAESNMELDPSLFGPATTTALQSLIDAALRDYINYWYKPILPSESTFPISCRRTMTGFINSISSHLCRKRTTDTFLEFLTNSSSVVIVFLNELSTAFEATDPEISTEGVVLKYLESNPESSLSSLLAIEQQRKKLTTISDDILSRFLDAAAYNCAPLRNFLREILAGVVLESTISSLSRPEFINGWIQYLFSEGESEIMNAIDAGVEGARTHGVTAVEASGELTRPATIATDSGVRVARSAPRFSDPVSTKTDQATEEAMVEAKRLSAMIAAQNLQQYSEQTIDGNVHEGYSTTGNDDTRAFTDLANAAGRNSSFEASSPEACCTERDTGDNLLSPLSLHRPGPYSPERFDTSTCLSLHSASITVDDGSDAGDKTTLRSKPTSSYLLQVEPRSGRSSGWMVFRKYAEFESIHETLETISRLNQLRFGDSHPAVPAWKGRTRHALSRDLERYLQDALQLEPLAESVTMRRFLEKDHSLSAGDDEKPGFVFPGQAAFENVGKGVLGVLANAPKGVTGGGKAVFGGVTGVFGGGASKKTPVGESAGSPRKDESVLRVNESIEEGVRPSAHPTGSNSLSRLPESSNTPGSISPKEVTSLTESASTPIQTPESGEKVMDKMAHRRSCDNALLGNTNMSPESIKFSVVERNEDGDASRLESRQSTDIQAKQKAQDDRITTDESRMAVELIFAVINELYSLSSAWNIRRTLLNAAKTYILRPGNPSLEAIRDLLQDSMIDSHTSDKAIGTYLAKIRESALPTADELDSWPAPMPDTEKERQREAARLALIQRGLPEAITGVMGAAASREALGRVFDSLQIEVVARGFVFSILLQALRAVAL
ncbi:PXA domain-containing protein [Aspergillus egyptiacus]|nr:PXA domain-containing protein [Aspergillus egyptiacus]